MKGLVMRKYRLYRFDEHNRREYAIDFEASSDPEAYQKADRLLARQGFGNFELWRGEVMLHCSADEIC